MNTDIFSFLRSNHLTTLKIRYDYKTDEMEYLALKEWEEDRDFSRYNVDFFAGSFLSDHSVFVAGEALVDKMKEEGTYERFSDLLTLMREYKYFGVDFYDYPKYDIKLIAFDHNRTRGIHNKAWGKTLGGIRRHLPGKSEWEIIEDGIKLGSAMSYKAAAIDLPTGGSKLLVQMEEPDLGNREVLGFLAYVTDQSHVITAPDMNLSIELSDAVKHFGYSKLFVGGKTAKVGAPGDATALGILLSMKAAVEFREGKKEFPLEGKKIVLMGHGSVGRPLLKHLLEEKAKVTLAVRHPGAGTQDVPEISYDDAIYQEGDILCPCGGGGVIREEMIDSLKYKYIWGAANNQLAAETREDEYRMARKIKERGILYEAEWWHNGGGIMCMAEEYFFDGSKETVEEKLKKTVPAKTWEVLQEAEDKNLTPTEVCYEKCERELYP